MNFISKLLCDKKTLHRLIKLFPAALGSDVTAVFEAMPKKDTRDHYDWDKFGFRHKNRPLSEYKGGTFYLAHGKRVEMPYRVYYEDIIEDKALSSLTPTQQMIYHCIFTLSYDGYVREKHIKLLLEREDIPEFVYPFILICGSDYVVEIVRAVYDKLKDKDNSNLKAFCLDEENLQELLYRQARMTSYWDVYYRGDCYEYKNYVGRKLFCECFGYSRYMEKYRKKRSKA